jgi:hypothetical protein
VRWILAIKISVRARTRIALRSTLAVIPLLVVVLQDVLSRAQQDTQIQVVVKFTPK